MNKKRAKPERQADRAHKWGRGRSERGAAGFGAPLVNERRATRVKGGLPVGCQFRQGWQRGRDDGEASKTRGREEEKKEGDGQVCLDYKIGGCSWTGSREGWCCAAVLGRMSEHGWTRALYVSPVA
jgi:hypothetical protein